VSSPKSIDKSRRSQPISERPSDREIHSGAVDSIRRHDDTAPIHAGGGLQNGRSTAFDDAIAGTAQIIESSRAANIGMRVADAFKQASTETKDLMRRSIKGDGATADVYKDDVKHSSDRETEASRPPSHRRKETEVMKDSKPHGYPRKGAAEGAEDSNLMAEFSGGATLTAGEQ
jgi:hypothetical protein